MQWETWGLCVAFAVSAVSCFFLFFCAVGLCVAFTVTFAAMFVGIEFMCDFTIAVTLARVLIHWWPA